MCLSQSLRSLTGFFHFSYMHRRFIVQVVREDTMGSGSLGCMVDAEQLVPMQKSRQRQPGRR